MSPESTVPVSNREPYHIVIMGLMGSGKSTLGTKVADRLNWQYSDSDQELQERTGLTGAEFAAAYGVDALHVIEAALVLVALGSNERTVITAAGSTIENDIVRRTIQSRAAVAYLVVPVEELRRRHGRKSHRRSLKAGELEAQFARRDPLFTDIADVIVPPNQRVADTVRAVLSLVD